MSAIYLYHIFYGALGMLTSDKAASITSVFYNIEYYLLKMLYNIESFVSQIQNLF